MRADAPKQMTAAAFVEWAMRRPEGERYELVGGEVVAMAPERARHVRVKQRCARLLEDAIAAAGLACESFVDGLSVQVDETTVYEPDVLVRCGEPLDDEAVFAPDPVIVVEVVSPSSAGVDTGGKLEGYFRLPSVRHYLVVLPERATVLHHARRDDGTLATAVRRDGTLGLDPPGLTIEVRALFAR